MQAGYGSSRVSGCCGSGSTELLLLLLAYVYCILGFILDLLRIVPSRVVIIPCKTVKLGFGVWRLARTGIRRNRLLGLVGLDSL